MSTLLYFVMVVVVLGLAYFIVLKPRGITLGSIKGVGRSLGGAKSGGMCPFCGSDDILYSPKRGLWECNNKACGEVFKDPAKVGK